MKCVTRFTLLGLAAFSLATSCRAASLIGSTVSGSLTFSGGSTNSFLPNTPATVGPGAEFTFVSTFNRISADFDALSLELTDVSFSPGANSPETFVFTDAAFAGLSLVPGSYTYPSAFTSSLVGNTLTTRSRTRHIVLDAVTD